MASVTSRALRTRNATMETGTRKCVTPESAEEWLFDRQARTKNDLVLHHSEYGSLNPDLILSLITRILPNMAK